MISTADIITVKELDLSSFSAGTLTRVWVRIASNGMANPIRVPVMVAKGSKPGPILGITAAVHGNELNGLQAVQRVFNTVDVNELSGTLVGVPVVNVPGFLLNQRAFNDGIDLNRIMPGKPNGNMSEVYAHRILKKIVRHFEYLLDLHTASFGRINSYYIRADMENEVTAQMAILQNADIIVHNPPHDGTLRGAAMDLGIPAITVEAGDPHRFQKGMIRSALTGIRNVMRHLEMTEEDVIPDAEPPYKCQRSYWIYTTIGGILEIFPQITDLVKKGERIALVRDVFGEILREYVAPEDGVVIGRSVNPINQTGSRILHLGILEKS